MWEVIDTREATGREMLTRFRCVARWACWRRPHLGYDRVDRKAPLRLTVRVALCAGSEAWVGPCAPTTLADALFDIIEDTASRS